MESLKNDKYHKAPTTKNKMILAPDVDDLRHPNQNDNCRLTEAKKSHDGLTEPQKFRKR